MEFRKMLVCSSGVQSLDKYQGHEYIHIIKYCMIIKIETHKWYLVRLNVLVLDKISNIVENYI